jgi:hypothetical protein
MVPDGFGLNSMQFDDMFYRKLELHGNAYFTATTEVRNSAMQYFAKRNMLPLEPLEGGTYKLQDIITPGYNQRLQAYGRHTIIVTFPFSSSAGFGPWGSICILCSHHLFLVCLVHSSYSVDCIGREKATSIESAIG